MDGAQEERGPGVEGGGVGPEAGVARVQGGSLSGGEESGVVVGEKEEEGVHCD